MVNVDELKAKLDDLIVEYDACFKRIDDFYLENRVPTYNGGRVVYQFNWMDYPEKYEEYFWDLEDVEERCKVVRKEWLKAVDVVDVYMDSDVQFMEAKKVYDMLITKGEGV